MSTFRSEIPGSGAVNSVSIIPPLLILFTLYLAALVLYRIYLHPLARIPGPGFAKFWGGYLTFAQVNFARAQKLRELHERYGPVIRVGSNEVSVSDIAAYREIYNIKASEKTYSFYGAASLAGHESSFTLRDKDQHSARRRLQSPLFSQSAIARNEDLIAAKADVLVQRMVNAVKASPSGRTVEAFRLCGLYTLEVFLKHSFNRDYNEAPDGEVLQFLEAMDSSAEANRIAVTLPFITRKIGSSLPGRIGHIFRGWDLWQEMTSALLKEFEERELDLDKEARFLATPAMTQDDGYLGRRLTHPELVEEFMSLTFAGSGTTSTTLAYLMYALARDPDLQQRLRDELKTVDGSLKAIRQLPLINAVIKEALRLYPSIISTLPRVLIRSMVFKDYELPKGTEIGMQNYVHQRDEHVFRQPDEFLPDRWIIEEDQKNVLDRSLTPFSVGHRNCVGQTLAWAELYLGVYKVVTTLKLSLNDSVKPSDMEMHDRFNMVPAKKSLLIDIEVLRR